MREVILEISDFSVYYNEKGSGMFSKKNRRQVVKSVSFELFEGEILGLVGESGCGKSSLARGILGLEPDCSGQVVTNAASPQMIFQDPFGSLNPRMTVARIVEEPLIIYGMKDRKVRQEQVVEMLKLVGLDERFLPRLPHELSGGQRQRVSIAVALIAGPRLLIADEFVSALDATIQVQILDLLWEIHEKLALSILLISHDLAVVESLCDRVLIMLGGEIVESGKIDEVFSKPNHKYTKQLLSAKG